MYDELVDLYERLDMYRQKRWQIAKFALLWALFIPFSLVLSRVVRFNAVTFYVYVFAVVLVIAVVGLSLLANFIKNEVRGRELERDVRDVKLRAMLGIDDDDLPRKRKRDDSDVRYAVGDDGELIEIHDEKPLRHQR